MITITIILPGQQAVNIEWRYGNSGGHNTTIKGPEGTRSCATRSPEDAVRIALMTYVGLA